MAKPIESALKRMARLKRELVKAERASAKLIRAMEQHLEKMRLEIRALKRKPKRRKRS